MEIRTIDDALIQVATAFKAGNENDILQITL